MTRIEDEIARRGIALRGRGPERCGPCPVCGAGTDRFSINTKKQLWYCRVCATGGDVIALVQHIDGVGFREACRILGGEVAVTSARPNPPPKPSPAAGQNDNSKRALTMWWTARPIISTLAETYLRSRSLEYLDPDGDVLRFHPHCPFGGEVRPCMIALFRAIIGNKPVAIHRTALTIDGCKFDRRTLGPIGGAAIKLSADEDVTMGLHVGEGIETTLAAMALGFRPAWALGSAEGIAKFPVLAGIEALTIITDHDKPDARGRQAGHEVALECSERWMSAAREVRSVVPRRLGADMADLVAG
jgi:putative DNA primase/helicase